MSAPMDVESNTATAAAANKRYKVDIFSTIKAAQNQNGLRHADFMRYRRYCTRRLARLRKSLKLSQANPNAYVKVTLTKAHVTNARVLELPLMQAERCWSHAVRFSLSTSFRARVYRLFPLAHVTLTQAHIHFPLVNNPREHANTNKRSTQQTNKQTNTDATEGRRDGRDAAQALSLREMPGASRAMERAIERVVRTQRRPAH
jgi:hypothetical protein